MTTLAFADAADRYAPDSAYAVSRMALSLLLTTIASVGMWAVVVVLPKVQAEFGVNRGAASMSYTMTMFGFAFGTIVLGRMADRRGIALPLVIAGGCLCVGFLIAGIAPSLWVFSAAHLLLIGVGAGAGFAPMMADISHWFVRRRAVAVVVVASGNYLAGTIWPLAMNVSLPLIGWRATFITLGIFVAATLIPAAWLLRRRPSMGVFADAEAAAKIAHVNGDVSPRLLMGLLIVAGFSCCAAMSMPQVHIVAYCGDLGYGAARGAEMLSLMLFLGIASRIGSGFVADVIGGVPTLLIGSFMQCLALLLYLYFTSLPGLFAVSGIFGLFQGGIVPMYAVICREVMPPRQAGAKIGIVVSATIFGMAFGGYVSGAIFDLTGSYRAAFLNGILWNFVNLAAVCWLSWRRRRPSPSGRYATARG